MLRDFPSFPASNGGGGGGGASTTSSSTLGSKGSGNNNIGNTTSPTSTVPMTPAVTTLHHSHSSPAVTAGESSSPPGSGLILRDFKSVPPPPLQTAEEKMRQQQQQQQNPKKDSWRDRAKAEGDIGACLYGDAGVFHPYYAGKENDTSVKTSKTVLDRGESGSSHDSIDDVAVKELLDEVRDQPTELGATASNTDHNGTGDNSRPLLGRKSLADVGSLTSQRRLNMEREKRRRHQPDSSLSTTQEELPHLLEEECDTPQQEKPHVINIQSLRRIASQGVSDVGSHRAVAWRVLLGYLPPDTSQWEQVLSRDRGLYRTLVAELFVKPASRQASITSSTLAEDEGADANVNNSAVPSRSAAAAVTPDGASADVDGDGRRSPPNATAASGAMDLLEDLEKAAGDNRNRWGASNELDSIGGIGGGSANSSSLLKTADVTSKTNTFSADKQGKDEEAVPTPHVPCLQDGYAALVPARIREQWKEAGKEAVLDNHCNTHIHHHSSIDPLSPTGALAVNALLVVDDEGYTPDDADHRNKRITINDDPLHVQDESRWHQFFENASLLDEIRKDVVRTHPDLHFFLEPEDNLGQRRYAALERVLFVWAKLNKGVRYVQGMNEIVGTIYFVLANDFNEEWAAEAEADAYFLFNILMVEMRDVFVPDLDEADTGIQGRISNMMALLSLHDPEVRCHLDDCGIDASFYSIRWLTTLLSREFCLPDTIRLWDSMFASTHKDNFLRYVCVTMVMMIRDQLLSGDFSTCLRLLQSYPPTNVDRMLESSRALWIYESQITLACHKGGISLGQALSSIAPPPGIIMAYGLPGGLAWDSVTRARQAGERGLNMARGAANNFTASASRNFLGKGLWKSRGERKQPERGTTNSTSDWSADTSPPRGRQNRMKHTVSMP